MTVTTSGSPARLTTHESPMRSTLRSPVGGCSGYSGDAGSSDVELPERRVQASGLRGAPLPRDRGAEDDRPDAGEPQSEPPAEEGEAARARVGVRNQQHAAGDARQLEQVVRADPSGTLERRRQREDGGVLDAVGETAVAEHRPERVCDLLRGLAELPAAVDDLDAVAVGEVERADLAVER